MKCKAGPAGGDVAAHVIEAEIQQDGKAVGRILEGLDARHPLYGCIRTLHESWQAISGTREAMASSAQRLAMAIENPPKKRELFQLLLVRFVRVAVRLGNYAEAARALRLLESVAPQGACRTEIAALTLHCRAGVLQLAGNHREALAAVNAALVLVEDRRDRLWFAIKTGRAGAALNLHDALTAEADLAELESAPEEFRDLFPVSLGHFRAWVLKAGGRHVEALAALDAEHPVPPESAFRRRLWASERARLLVYSLRVDEGLRFLEEHRADIQPFQYEEIQAFAAWARDDFEGARRHIRAAVVADPTRPRTIQLAAWFMACTELSEHNTRAARLLLRSIDPDETNAAHAMEWCRLYALDGDELRAARHLRTVLQGRTVAGLTGPLHGVAEMSLHQFARLMVLASGGGPPEKGQKELPGRGELAAHSKTISAGAAATVSEASPARKPRPAPPELVGESPAILKARADIAKFAPLEETVLITGETGTGKELVAQLLHDRSPRARGPFLAVNCAAISDTLLESELFGHVKGAFTGAVTDHDGLLVAAGGGTIFFDEVDSMSPQVQASMLRVLEERRIRPVGSTSSHPFRARVLAAGGAGLAGGASSGSIRSDLYFRLARLRIDLPPLRERPEDVAPLAAHFLDERFGSGTVVLGEDLLAALRSHSWPGNVRELRNEIQRIAIMSCGAKVLRADLFAASGGPSPATPTAAGKNSRGRRVALRDLFRKRGELSRGEASTLLGVAPVTAAKDLEALRAEGLIERVEPTGSPRTHYFRAKPPSPGPAGNAASGRQE